MADVAFDFNFADSPASLDRPVTPHGLPLNMNYFPFDSSSMLEVPFMPRHARSSSQASSIYSAISTVESTPDSVCTRMSTPPRASPPIGRSGPLLLPKIRSQDQEIDTPQYNPAPVPQRKKTISSGVTKRKRATPHARSQTNPETLSKMAMAHLSSMGMPDASSYNKDAALLNSAMAYTNPNQVSGPRRSSTCSAIDGQFDRYGYPIYHQVPFSQVSGDSNNMPMYQSYAPRAESPLSQESTPDPTPSTTLMSFLTAANPASSLVQGASDSSDFRSHSARNDKLKHFWWDVRKVRTWTHFNMTTILNMPGAYDLLTSPVPAPLLPQPAFSSRFPQSESDLHSIFKSFYLPKVNSALAISSSHPLQLTVPSTLPPNMMDLPFVGNAESDPAVAAAMFGGNPSARVVGIVRTFNNFNTGMRVQGNIAHVKYLKGLAAIHHAMREHSCRYGFILTEIELVIVRNGIDVVPLFGELDIVSIPLATSVSEADLESSADVPMTACLALWALCQMANDNTGATGQAHFKAEIGAPAQGTRQNAADRDDAIAKIPGPQEREKRESKQSRGWFWPQDPIGKKEVGKRRVKYNNASM